MLPNRLRDQLEGLRLHRRTCGNDVILCMYGGKATGYQMPLERHFKERYVGGELQANE